MAVGFILSIPTHLTKTGEKLIKTAPKISIAIGETVGLVGRPESLPATGLKWKSFILTEFSFFLTSRCGHLPRTFFQCGLSKKPPDGGFF